MNSEKKQDDKNLDDLICNIAPSSTEKNYIDLYKSLMNSEIYAPIANKDSYKTNNIQFPYTTIENKKMVMFYVSSDDNRLGKPFSGMMGNNALKMILDIKEVDGILLQSSKQESWFAITKEQISNILNKQNK